MPFNVKQARATLEVVYLRVVSAELCNSDSFSLMSLVFRYTEVQTGFFYLETAQHGLRGQLLIDNCLSKYVQAGK